MGAAFAHINSSITRKTLPQFVGLVLFLFLLYNIFFLNFVLHIDIHRARQTEFDLFFIFEGIS